MGTIDVITANNNGRELEALVIGVDHHLGSSLACSVRVGWGQDAGLLQLVFAVANFAINLVC